MSTIPPGQHVRCYPDLIHQKHSGAMMLKPVPLHSLAGKEFVPQAVIDYPMSFFEEKLRMPAVHEQDDLDEYEAIALIIDDGGVLVELKHYAGYPENTTTIYLSDFINNVAQIS